MDERRGALDLGNLNLGARLDHVAFVERNSAPYLAADLDVAAVQVDLVDDDRARADERGGARPDRMRHLQMAAGDRPQDSERNAGAGDEHDEVDHPAAPERRRRRRRNRCDRNRPEEEQAGREQFTDRERDSEDSPDDPGRHDAIVEGRTGRRGAEYKTEPRPVTRSASRRPTGLRLRAQSEAGARRSSLRATGQVRAATECAHMLVLAAPDKFRGTLAAADAARAIAEGARRAGWRCRELPLADGGEGTLEVLGGPNRVTRVSGPLGSPVEAAWRLVDGVAVIEAARASGLAVVGGAGANDPLAASTRGTGELIAAALGAGAEALVVGIGGSASTDGGLGAIEALGRSRFQIPVEVACDVRTRFLEAAAVFGPQKGASPAQVALLTERLGTLAQSYLAEFGVDVAALPGSGAAGGLAGGLAALGAELVAGFELVAGRLGLEQALEGADLVVTGEGKLDATSFDGKVVGGLLAACARRGLPAVVVAGEIESGTPVAGAAVSLVDRFGRERAFAEPAACIADVVADYLAS